MSEGNRNLKDSDRGREGKGSEKEKGRMRVTQSFFGSMKDARPYLFQPGEEGKRSTMEPYATLRSLEGRVQL